MRLFVRLSLIGLISLVAIGFAINQMSQTDGNKELLPVKLSDGQCTDKGVSLVIDFGTKQELPRIEKCIENYSGTSWDLFAEAKLTVTGTQKYPVGFVCRIEGFPSETTEPCNDTPGASHGSWAFFQGNPDQSWKYSVSGAATYKPGCGSVDGWRFLEFGEPVTATPRISPRVNVCN